MQLEYNLTESDLVLFSEYHADHSPSIQRSRRFQRFGMPLILMATGLYLILREPNFLVAIIFFPILLLIMVAWVVWSPSLFRTQYRRQVIKMYREGGNQMLLGKQILRADDDGLHSASAAGDSRTNWAAVERIVSTSDYTFIYLGATTAIVIPQKAIASGNYDEFVRLVHYKHRDALSK